MGKTSNLTTVPLSSTSLLDRIQDKVQRGKARKVLPRKVDLRDLPTCLLCQIAKEHNQKVNWVTIAKELGIHVKVREKYSRMVRVATCRCRISKAPVCLTFPHLFVANQHARAEGKNVVVSNPVSVNSTH